MNKEELLQYKYFEPHFLSAIKWNKDNLPEAITEYYTDPIVIVDSTEFDKIKELLQFSKLKIQHLTFIYHELNERHISFEEFKVNDNGKRIRTPVKELTKLIQKNEHPNKESEKVNISKKEQQKYCWFKPKYLTSTDWNNCMSVNISKSS